MRLISFTVEGDPTEDFVVLIDGATWTRDAISPDKKLPPPLVPPGNTQGLRQRFEWKKDIPFVLKGPGSPGLLLRHHKVTIHFECPCDSCKLVNKIGSTDETAGEGIVLEVNPALAGGGSTGGGGGGGGTSPSSCPPPTSPPPTSPPPPPPDSPPTGGGTTTVIGATDSEIGLLLEKVEKQGEPGAGEQNDHINQPAVKTPAATTTVPNPVPALTTPSLLIERSLGVVMTPRAGNVLLPEAIGAAGGIRSRGVLSNTGAAVNLDETAAWNVRSNYLPVETTGTTAATAWREIKVSGAKVKLSKVTGSNSLTIEFFRTDALGTAAERTMVITRAVSATALTDDPGYTYATRYTVKDTNAAGVILKSAEYYFNTTPTATRTAQVTAASGEASNLMGWRRLEVWNTTAFNATAQTRTATYTSKIVKTGATEILESDVETEYQHFPWGEETTARRVLPATGEARQVTAYTYETLAADPNFGGLRMVVQPDGGWTAYLRTGNYETGYYHDHVIRPWKDTAAPAAGVLPALDASGCRYTQSVYEGGHLTSVTSTVKPGNSAYPTAHSTYRLSNMGARYASQESSGGQNFTTVTWRVPATDVAGNAGKTLKQYRLKAGATDENVALNVISCTQYRYTSFPAAGAALTVPSANATYQQTETLDDITHFPCRGSRVLVEGATGFVRREQELIWTSDSASEVLHTTDYYPYRDGGNAEVMENGAVTSMSGSFDTEDAITTTQTENASINGAPNGASTTTVVDRLGRVVSRTRTFSAGTAVTLQGITVPALDVAGGSVTQTTTTAYAARTGGGVRVTTTGNGIVSETDTDLLGRTRRTKDAAGGAGTVEYALRTVRQYRGEGASRVQLSESVSYIDGRTKSTAETGGRTVATDYTVDSDYREKTTSVPDGNNDARTESTTDAMGRMISQSRVVSALDLYGVTGPLVRFTSDYLYDDEGRMVAESQPQSDWDAVSAPGKVVWRVQCHLRQAGGWEVSDSALSLDPVFDETDHAVRRSMSRMVKHTAENDTLWWTESAAFVRRAGADGVTQWLAQGSEESLIGPMPAQMVSSVRSLHDTVVEQQQTYRAGSVELTLSLPAGVAAAGKGWSVTRHGLPVKSVAPVSGGVTEWRYDALGRVVQVKDPVSGLYDERAYHSRTGAVEKERRPATQPGTWDTVYTFYLDDATRSGRVASVTRNGAVIHYDYTDRGQVWQVWGGGGYPLTYGYDPVTGAMTEMRTYRGTAGFVAGRPPATGGDVTRWKYHAVTGQLLWKEYAPTAAHPAVGGYGPRVMYSYWPNGALRTRLWARGALTHYVYTGWGELADTTYHLRSAAGVITEDTATRAVHYTYDISGLPFTLQDAAGLHYYTFTPEGRPSRETMINGLLGPTVIDYAYDGYGRRKRLGVAAAGAGMPEVTYWYDGATQRLAEIRSASNRVQYGYHPGLNRVRTRTAKRLNLNRPMLEAVESLTPDGDVQSVVNRTYAVGTPPSSPPLSGPPPEPPPGAASTIASHVYRYNARGERDRAEREDGRMWAYAYDDKGQVTAGKKLAGGSSTLGTNVLRGLDFAYGYDEIGNRQWSEDGGGMGTARRRHNYTPAADNTYTYISLAPGSPDSFDITGSAPAAAPLAILAGPQGSMALGLVTPLTRQGSHFHAEVPRYTWTPQGESESVSSFITYAKLDEGSTTKAQGYHQHRPAAATLNYDADGNCTWDGIRACTWDGENRLISVSLSNGFENVNTETYSYDAMSRRIFKQWTRANGPPLPGTSVPSTVSYAERFIYDGWNPVAVQREESIPPVPPLTAGSYSYTWRAFVWGPDLSGSLQGAGGVGGLIMVSDYSARPSASLDEPAPPESYLPGQAPPHYTYPAYDGNGNVSALVDDSGVTVATYEYDPFGRPLRATGAAHRCPFRFSTKYTDEDTGLIYYGYRYYEPWAGRWLGRDPIEEEGGVNLFAFVKNTPTRTIDVLGLLKASVDVFYGEAAGVDAELAWRWGADRREHRTAVGKRGKNVWAYDWKIGVAWEWEPTRDGVKLRGPRVLPPITFSSVESDGDAIFTTPSFAYSSQWKKKGEEVDVNALRRDSSDEDCVECMQAYGDIYLTSSTATLAGSSASFVQMLSTAVDALPEGKAALPGGEVAETVLGLVGSALSVGDADRLVTERKARVLLVICADGKRFVGVYNTPRANVDYRYGWSPLVRRVLNGTWIHANPGGKTDVLMHDNMLDPYVDWDGQPRLYNHTDSKSVIFEARDKK